MFTWSYDRETAINAFSMATYIYTLNSQLPGLFENRYILLTTCITPVLVDLHWLPIKYRIEFKIALLVYKALNEMSPIYISELLVLKPSGPYQLRSDKQQFLLVPRTKTKFGDRAFASAGPKVWNSLPLTVRLSKNINTFKVELKTYLFKKAFNL